MKPHEAAEYLRYLMRFVATDSRIPGHLLTWFSVAVHHRLRDPATSLDKLLGLRSNAGGRLTLFCQLPKRDEALRYLAASMGPLGLKAKATEITRRKLAGELSGIEALGSVPGPRRLMQILKK